MKALILFYPHPPPPIPSPQEIPVKLRTFQYNNFTFMTPHPLRISHDLPRGAFE